MQQEQPNPTQPCPQCGSESTTFDATYGFHQCLNCQAVWGYPEDDPDLDEAADYSEVLEQIYETDPQYWARLIEGRS